MNVLQYLCHCTLQKFGNNFLTTFILSLNVRTWKTFSIISTIFIKILTLLWKKVMEAAFLETLLKQDNGEISVLVYKKPTHTDQYLQYSSHHQTSCMESVISSLFNRAYSITTKKMTYTKKTLE